MISTSPAGDSVSESGDRASGRSLRGDVVLMAGAKFGVLVLSAGATIIIARRLGPVGRGSMAAAFAFMTVLAQLGTMGVASANPFFVAQQPDLRRRLATNSLWFAAVLGTVMTLIGLMLKWLVPSVVAGLSWPVLGLALGGVPIMICSLFLQSILLGEGRMALYNGTDLCASAVTVIVLFAFLPTSRRGVFVALLLTITPQIAALLTYLFAARGSGRLLRAPDLQLARRMVGYGLRAYLVTLVAFLLIRIDLLLVNGIQGARSAGLYSIAVAIADAMYILPMAVAVNLFPRVARGADNTLTVGVFHLVAFGYLFVCAVVGVVARPAIGIFFGSVYEPAAPLLWWLLPGVYCLGVLNIIAYHFAGRGLPRELVLVWIPGLILNLAIDIVLLPRTGTYIASLASSLAYGIVLVLHLRMFARETGGWRGLLPSLRQTVAVVRLAVGKA